MFDSELPLAAAGSMAASEITEVLATRVAAHQDYAVVAPGEVREAIDKRKIESYKECYSESCQLEIGKELAADTILTWRLAILETRCLLTIRLYDLQQASTIRAGMASGGCSADALYEVAIAAWRSLTVEKGSLVTLDVGATEVEALSSRRDPCAILADLCVKPASAKVEEVCMLLAEHPQRGTRKACVDASRLLVGQPARTGERERESD